jgi:hypothetical protein
MILENVPMDTIQKISSIVYKPTSHNVSLNFLFRLWDIYQLAKNGYQYDSTDDPILQSIRNQYTPKGNKDLINKFIEIYERFIDEWDEEAEKYLVDDNENPVNDFNDSFFSIYLFNTILYLWYKMFDKDDENEWVGIPDSIIDVDQLLKQFC